MKVTQFVRSFALAAMAIAAISSSRAEAALLISDNFDGYANQAAFDAVWAPITTGGTLTSALSVSAPNSVNYATTAQRNGQTVAETGVVSGSNIVSFSFDFYDSNAALAPYRQFANLQDGASPTSTGQLVSMGLNNNLTSAADGGNYYMARILGLDGGTGASAYFKLNNAGAPLRSTGWHNLRVDISDLVFNFYVDGFLAQTIANTGTARSYETVRLGSGLSSTASANFDNARLETLQVPEPATLALAGLGLLGLGSVVRRQRA
ncbi:PEP-CTERM sorting domain-containing protein [Lacipirellula limnantheis]|uniref:PEP-CTERM motif protein n=1 Tax=Lacipirellula limnantheis TaxID=2528024 RepID=A0A517U3I1_9BACT|nr:PEP-CTERM sorting domain-containing protein [Lacipirellula limnantheis]QDT75180.1 PEP-CTERM motif protein [Lacipirellula limnantheis]